MTPPDITKLIVRASMRDRAAFDSLYRATSAKLFGVCLRVLNDRAEAEEALQEVFVKIWTKADRFAASDLSPISWLVAVARNHAIDRVRARRRPHSDIDDALDIVDPALRPEAAAVTAGEREKIHGCLEKLEKVKSTRCMAPTRNVPCFHCAADNPLFEASAELLTDTLPEAPAVRRAYLHDRQADNRNPGYRLSEGRTAFQICDVRVDAIRRCCKALSGHPTNGFVRVPCRSRRALLRLQDGRSDVLRLR